MFRDLQLSTTVSGLLLILLWFMPLNFHYGMYQYGGDIGGIAFLLLGSSIWFTYVAWQGIVSLMLLSSILNLIVVFYIILAGSVTDIAWGLVIMIILIVANIIMSIKEVILCNRES